MAIYDGVVTLADEEVPVIVELDEEHVRMSASGTEIGHWLAAECEINHLEDTVYSITAENETIRFVPNQPSLFAAAVNRVAGQPGPDRAPATGADDDPGVVTESAFRHGEAPPPKPLTVGLFYALCVVTAALAVWALIAIVF